MDISLSFPALAAATLFGFFLFVYFLLPISRINQSNSSKKTAPEAGGAWPVIGHLHLLGGSQRSYVVLGDMADKYGPIFTIKMGVHQDLVVNDLEFPKECLTIKDKAFANRPKVLASGLLTYDGAMIGLATYGPYWRQVGKVATLHLLSNRRLYMFKQARDCRDEEVVWGHNDKRDLKDNCWEICGIYDNRRGRREDWTMETSIEGLFRDDREICGG